MNNDKFNLKANINKYKNENLIYCIVIPFTKHFLCTIIKTQALVYERSSIKFIQTPQLNDYLSFKYGMNNVPEKT